MERKERRCAFVLRLQRGGRENGDMETGGH